MPNKKKTISDKLTDLLRDHIKKNDERKNEFGKASKKTENLDNIPVFYAKNGRIKETTLLTKDTEAFIDWATFVWPPLQGYPEDFRTLAVDEEARVQLHGLLVNGMMVAMFSDGQLIEKP